MSKAAVHLVSRWLGNIGPLASVSLLVVLAYTTSPQRLLLTVRHANGVLFALNVVVAFLGWILMTKKWSLVLRTMGISGRFGRLIAINFSTNLWSMLLPAQIGGEVYRGSRLVAEGAPFRSVASAAAVDRASTATATALVGFMAGLLQINSETDPRLLAGVAIIAIVPITCCVAFRMPKVAQTITTFALQRFPARNAAMVEELLTWLRLHLGRMLFFLVLAVLCQMVFVVSLGFLVHSFGSSATLLQVAWVLSASSLAPYLLPLPGSSIAVQQGTLVYLLTRAGTTPQAATAVAVSALLCVLMLGFSGTVMEGARQFPRRGSGVATSNGVVFDGAGSTKSPL